jgi:hypothetical protein
MFTGIDHNTLNVLPHGLHNLVIERLLRLDETTGLLGDDPRVGVPGLMQVDILDPCGPRILLQIIGKGSRTELRTRSAGAIMKDLQRPTCSTARACSTADLNANNDRRNARR